MKNTLIIYIGLLGLAALEAFTPTAYLVPGTLGVTAAGGFVQAGKLNAPITLLVVWVGIMIGDLASFFLARKFGYVLRRWARIAAVLNRAESRLQRHPVAFMLLSRLSPFLKNASAPAAGLVGWSLRRFLALEILAALVDASWFLGLGYVVSASVGGMTKMPLVARVVGMVALLSVVLFFIGRGRKCRVPRTSASGSLKCKRGLAFVVKCLLLVGGWELGGRLAKRAGFFDRADYRAAFVRAVEYAEAGDIILVGRTTDAPWGQYSHAMMVVWTPNGKALIHAYESCVQLTPVNAAPMCGKVAVVHIECTRQQRVALVLAAWSLLATPFKLGSRKPDASPPTALNCIGLVAWAAGRAGIALDEIPVGGVLVPDDILTSANVRIVFEWHDGDGPPPPLSTIPISHRPTAPAPRPFVAAVRVSDDFVEADAATMVRSELFLGMCRKDGSDIPDFDVTKFVDEEVIPRFPAGTTQISASGTYASAAAGVIHERSRLLTILHRNDLLSRGRLRDVGAAYCAQFDQEMVLIAMTPAAVLRVAA